MKSVLIKIAICIIAFAYTSFAITAQTKLSILVFGKTAGFRHQSIAQGVVAIKNMAMDKEGNYVTMERFMPNHKF